MAVGPAHVGIDVAVSAVVLAELGGDDREAARDAYQAVRQAAVAGVEVVGVVGGDERLGRVAGQVVEPAAEVARPVEAAEQDRLLGTGRAHGVDQLLHAGRAVAAERSRRSVSQPDPPAFPADVVRLVVEVEEHGAVVAVFGRDAAPEVGRVVGIGHRRQPGRGVVARRYPVQVEDHVEARPARAAARIRGSRPDRPRRLVSRLDPAQAQPAALVERHPDRVDVPALDRPDRGPVGRTLEEFVALDAPVLGAGPVDAEQADRVAVDCRPACCRSPRSRAADEPCLCANRRPHRRRERDDDGNEREAERQLRRAVALTRGTWVI